MTAQGLRLTLELIERAQARLADESLDADEAYEILIRLRAMAETTLASVDPHHDWQPAMRCFSRWPRQLAGSDTAAPAEPDAAESGKRSGA